MGRALTSLSYDSTDRSCKFHEAASKSTNRIQDMQRPLPRKGEKEEEECRWLGEVNEVQMIWKTK